MRTRREEILIAFVRYVILWPMLTIFWAGVGIVSLIRLSVKDVKDAIKNG